MNEMITRFLNNPTARLYHPKASLWHDGDAVVVALHARPITRRILPGWDTEQAIRRIDNNRKHWTLY